MAIVLRSKMVRLVPNQVLLAAAKQLPSLQQAAGISSKIWRDLNGIKRLPPYNYIEKPFNYWRSCLDPTLARFDDNTKVILVEGPVTAGKTGFAQELAKELDMHYVEHATTDRVFINGYGFDLRTLDHKLPKGAQTFDEKKFLAEPNARLTAAMQLWLYHLRYVDYIQALAHLFSTGQGVVLDRSAYSDLVFVETLYRNQLITRNSHRALHEIRDNTLQELLRPHLVIYLDVPVDTVQKNIRERNKWGEANSPLFKNDNFLNTMEEVYKQEFLQDISKHAEILVYDWSNGGEVELVVEDIERIDFDRFDKEDPKMLDWKIKPDDDTYAEMRMQYTQDASQLEMLMNVPVYYAPDMLIQPEDDIAREHVWDEAPGEKFAFGYNRDMGDNIWFKTKDQYPKSIESIGDGK